MAIHNPKFEDSYGRLFGPNVALNRASDQFFYRFYERFLASQEISDLFRDTDMDQQIQMLKRSLLHLVAYYVTGEPTAELERIGHIHRKLRVKPYMFEQWLESLVETVLEYDLHADEETRLAWFWALSPGVTYMRLATSGALTEV